MYKVTGILSLAFFLLSCKSNTGNSDKEKGDNKKDSITKNEAKELMPEVRVCDSAIVMYYHTPGDHRFFNMTKVHQLDSLSAVIDDVNKKPFTPTDSCATQGKIYFYKGEAVYPVYFSRKEGCMTLSFIKTGEKYITVMSSKAKEVLDDMEKRVKVFPGRQE